MPVSFCEVTSSMAPVATAASMALPPWRRMSSPACAASGSLVATMPWRATTSERPWLSQPCAREPGTALMSAAGCGVAADGWPKGFWDWAVSAAQAPTASTAVTRVRRRERRPADGRGRVAGMRLLRDCISSRTSGGKASVT